MFFDDLLLLLLLFLLLLLGLTLGVANILHAGDASRAAETSLPLAGGVVRVELDFDLVAATLRPGLRLRVAVTSQYWPIVWPCAMPDGARLRLITGGESVLRAPVAPPALAECAAPGRAEIAEPPRGARVRAPRRSRLQGINDEGRRQLVVLDDGGARCYDERAGAGAAGDYCASSLYDEKCREAYSIAASGAPQTASAACTFEVAVGRGNKPTAGARA